MMDILLGLCGIPATLLILVIAIIIVFAISAKKYIDWAIRTKIIWYRFIWLKTNIVCWINLNFLISLLNNY